MDEIWKEIEDFNGAYRISNYGRLMSKKSGTWNILSVKNSKGSYLSAVLISGNKRKSKKIHQLVYEYFGSEKALGDNFEIHHKNGDKQDNNIDNLQLISKKEHNERHRLMNPNILRGMIQYNQNVRPKKVVQKSLSGDVIAVFCNCKEASRNTGVCSRNIHQVASKTPFNKSGSIRKQAGGFIWEFAD